MKKVMILISLVVLMFLVAGCGENIAGQAVGTTGLTLTDGDWIMIKRAMEEK